MRRNTLMSVSLVAAAFLSAAVLPENAAAAESPDSRSEKAARLARVLTDGGSLDQTLDRGAAYAAAAGAPALEARLGRALTDEESDRLEAIIRNVLTRFLTKEKWEKVTAAAYEERFTAGEMDAILTFLGSPAGKKLLNLQPELGREFGDAAQAIVVERLDEFRDAVDAAVDKSFGTAGAEGSQ